MGVRVIDDDDADFCNTSCYSCDSLATTATTAATSKSSNHSATNTTHYHHESKTTETICGGASAAAAAIFARASKDLVGNCKEFRIENNKSDLRIIGNGNRIRIGQNAGNLVIIGNSTKLKITKNDGHIKYTGNEGRICLGSESTQQLVDYIGCNGILKIKTVIEMEKSDKARKAAEKQKAVNVPAALKVKSNAAAATTKSASFGGCASARVDDNNNVDAAHWQHFKKMFKRENWQQRRQINTSLPNLKEHSNCQCGKAKKTNNGSSDSSQQYCNINNSISVVNNVGNIVIKNAVNVRI